MSQITLADCTTWMMQMCSRGYEAVLELGDWQTTAVLVNWKRKTVLEYESGDVHSWQFATMSEYYKYLAEAMELEDQLNG